MILPRNKLVPSFNWNSDLAWLFRSRNQKAKKHDDNIENSLTAAEKTLGRKIHVKKMSM